MAVVAGRITLGGQSGSIGKILGRVGFYTALIVVSLIWLLPLLWLMSTSIKPTALTFALPPVLLFTPTVEHYVDVLSNTAMFRNAANSLIISLSGSAICVVIGSMAAYSIVRYEVGGRWLRMLILGVRMIPPAVLALPLFVMFQAWALVDTWISVVWAHLTFTLPFTIWLVAGFIDEVPAEIEEAAMVDGCSPFKAMTKVTLPLVAPGLSVAAFFAFIFSWNEFLYSLVLTIERAKTLPVVAAGYISNQSIMWGPICALGTLMIVPPVVFVAFTHRYIVRGLTMGGIK